MTTLLQFPSPHQSRLHSSQNTPFYLRTDESPLEAMPSHDSPPSAGGTTDGHVDQSLPITMPTIRGRGRLQPSPSWSNAPLPALSTAPQPRPVVEYKSAPVPAISEIPQSGRESVMHTASDVASSSGSRYCNLQFPGPRVTDTATASHTGLHPIDNSRCYPEFPRYTHSRAAKFQG